MYNANYLCLRLLRINKTGNFVKLLQKKTYEIIQNFLPSTM